MLRQRDTNIQSSDCGHMLLWIDNGSARRAPDRDGEKFKPRGHVSEQSREALCLNWEWARLKRSPSHSRKGVVHFDKRVEGQRIFLMF